MTDAGSFRTGMITSLSLGAVSVPGSLLRSYAKLGLTEIEAMLLIHLFYFASHENMTFPTPDQLAERMSASQTAVLSALERLVREGFVTIEEENDAITGVRGERYNLTPLYEKLAVSWEVQPLKTEAPARSASSRQGEEASPSRSSGSSLRRDLFSVFESEFARPLSPIEYETIIGWLDQDQYSESLIMTALKEAVFAGKVHFRYVDRILMEWRRNRISTPEEAKAYTERFRGNR